MGMVPIKVKISRGADGRGQAVMKWPSFNDLPAEARDGMDWSAFIDSRGIGWFYDKVANIGKGDDEECACTMVPRAFADAAVAKFPDQVAIISEDDFADFHDGRSCCYEPDELVDEKVLSAMLLRKQLEDAGLLPMPTLEALSKRVRALDPDDPMPGIRRNPVRTWAGRKKSLKKAFDIDAACASKRPELLAERKPAK